MRGSSSTRIRGAGIAPWLVAFALLLRVLVPPGWMPATGQGFTITLCTGTGPATTLLDLEGVPVPHKQGSAPTDHPCAFAGMAVPLHHGGAVAILAPAPSHDEPARPPRLLASIGLGLAAPPPPSTGPPATI